jgi:hypothetical protein
LINLCSKCFNGAAFRLFAKNMGNKMLEQRINITFLVQLKMGVTLKKGTVSLWRHNNE